MDQRLKELLPEQTEKNIEFDRRFLAEVERRAGASVQEIAQDIQRVMSGSWCGHCDGDASVGCARWLRRILGQEDTRREAL